MAAPGDAAAGAGQQQVVWLDRGTHAIPAPSAGPARRPPRPDRNRRSAAPSPPHGRRRELAAHPSSARGGRGQPHPARLLDGHDRERRPSPTVGVARPAGATAFMTWPPNRAGVEPRADLPGQARPSGQGTRPSTSRHTSRSSTPTRPSTPTQGSPPPESGARRLTSRPRRHGRWPGTQHDPKRAEALKLVSEDRHRTGLTRQTLPGALECWFIAA